MRFSIRRVLVLCLVGFAATTSRADDPQPGKADCVFKNGKIWTVNSRQPEAQAIAVWRDRIFLVGSDADMAAVTGPGTRTIDLAGKRVVPGFYDSHVHFLDGGEKLSEVALKDAADEAEFGKRLKEFAAKLPKGRWLLGGNWDHDRAFKGELPTASLIDKYAPDHPVFLSRYDGHMAIANTAALKLAGVTAATPDPAGGVIFRKPGSKEPSGILRDNAMGLVGRHVPGASTEQIVEGVKAAMAEARQLGITSVQDMDGSGSRRELFRLYQTLARNGQLTVRIELRWPIAQWQELARMGVQQNFGDDWVKIGGLKGFVDGSIGSNTAKMYDPFLNEPDSSGIFVTPMSKLKEYILGADKAGISIAVHAIGDRANAELLDVFAEVAKANGPRDRRFRIEHVQHLRAQDIPRFRELGVIASMQPYHAIDDGRWVEGRIGTERCKTSYAFRSILEAGGKVAFGSDWSVAPLSAIEGIDAAVNRRTLDGKHPSGWFPELKITVQQAVEAYTLTSAYAAFQEKDRGSIEAGKLADFVVLSRDILLPAEVDRIVSTQVDMTVVGGKVVYERAGK